MAARIPYQIASFFGAKKTVTLTIFIGTAYYYYIMSFLYMGPSHQHTSQGGLFSLFSAHKKFTTKISITLLC